MVLGSSGEVGHGGRMGREKGMVCVCVCVSDVRAIPLQL